MALRIAIIEDETSIAQMYEFKFKQAGYDVQYATTGDDAVKLIAEMRPNLILLDLMLPGMTGEQILQKVRAEDWGKDIKVIVLTNTSAEAAPDELNTLGISRYVIKAQNTPAQLLQTVEEVLNSGESYD
ncbi:MAG TPA: response regulator [Candidatus Saccharimonadales bacterium]|nr:response regulator [Candidatus Saccharimonadales bacterium]